MVPKLPTTRHVEDWQLMPRRGRSVPESWLIQLLPPSVVILIPPPPKPKKNSPCASRHVVALVQLIAAPGPSRWKRQVVPPSVVTSWTPRMLAVGPTATHVVVLGQLIAPTPRSEL